MTMTAKFGGSCKRCGGRFPVGTKIDWNPGGRGATHMMCPPVAPVVATALVTAPVAVGSFSGVIALFDVAKTHLKFPKITLLCNGKKITLSVAGARSKNPGSVNIVGEGKFPNREWFGRVTPEGNWIPSRSGVWMMEALTTLLTEFSADPAKVAKEHGRLTGSCCFCNKTLGLGEDKRSIVVGFGPVCAEHFGLKTEWLSGVTAAEVAVVASAA